MAHSILFASNLSKIAMLHIIVVNDMLLLAGQLLIRRRQQLALPSDKVADRVGALGAGAAAAKRRGWALQEEVRMSKERSAHMLCLAQGHHTLRRGQFLL